MWQLLCYWWQATWAFAADHEYQHMSTYRNSSNENTANIMANLSIDNNKSGLQTTAILYPLRLTSP